MAKGQSAPPAPPSPGQQTRESIEAQIETLPEQLRAQQQFGPAFARQAAEQQLGLQREFGQQFLEQEREFAPEISAGRESLTRFLGRGPLEEFRTTAQSALGEFLGGGEVLSEAQRRNMEQDVRSAQNVRGFGIESPLGSLEEVRQLEGLRQNIRLNRLQQTLGVAGGVLGAEQQLAGTGLSALGQLPTGQQQFAGQFGPTLTQRPDPTSLAQQQSMFFREQAGRPQQPSIFGQIGGAVVGGLVGSATGGLGTAAGAKLGSTLFR